MKYLEKYFFNSSAGPEMYEKFGFISNIKKYFSPFKDYFTDDEFLKLCEIQDENLVLVTTIKSGDKNKNKSIEIFFGSRNRNSVSPQYITIYKQDFKYKIIGFEEVENVAEDVDYRLTQFNTIDEVIIEIEKRILSLLIATIVVKKCDREDVTKSHNIILITRRNIVISDGEYNEAKNLINEYSILNNNRLNIKRLKMLLNDEGCTDMEDILMDKLENLKNINPNKTFERLNQSQIETIEDLFTMYFIDGWGAVDTLKVPKETSQDYEDYLKIPMLYRLSVDDRKDVFRCSIFISVELVDMVKFLSDVNKFIERVRKNINSDTFSCRAAFQESGTGNMKKVYVIRFANF